ncbi:hypothetical protein LZ30DRAFT_480010 [Colletotrichum cereale]|nr:hypothetical protein LZ30DRAFT_480010 [Colletotrichum cereale]
MLETYVRIRVFGTRGIEPCAVLAGRSTRARRPLIIGCRLSRGMNWRCSRFLELVSVAPGQPVRSEAHIKVPRCAGAPQSCHVRKIGQLTGVARMIALGERCGSRAAWTTGLRAGKCKRVPGKLWGFEIRSLSIDPQLPTLSFISTATITP